MTSIGTKVLAKVNSLIQAVLTMFDDILKAAGRIFGPNDDDYPGTGVQPFEGEIPDIHQRRS